MSYIRVDKGLCNKPKFCRLLRESGLSKVELIGHLVLIWSAVDELGEDFHGELEDIACAVCAPSALVCALCAVGWAERFEGGITFHSNDPAACARTEAHRARARRSYLKKKGLVPPKDDEALRAESAPLCASAPPPSLPSPTPESPPPPSSASRGRQKPGLSHPQATLETEMGASPDGMRMEMDEIRKAVDGDITDCPRKAFLIRSVVSQCHPKTQVKLMRTIIGWPPGEWIYKAYEGWKKGAESAANKPAYFAKCIMNAEPPTAAGGRR